MKFKPGITPRLTLIFVVFAFGLTSAVSFFAYHRGQAALEETTSAGLLSTALEKQAALNAWVDHHLSDLVQLANSPGFLEMAGQFVDQGSNGAAHDRLVSELQNWTWNGTPFLSLLLLDPVSGQVLISSNPREEGKFKEDQPFFIYGKQGPFVQNPYYSISLQNPAMTISAPLKLSSGDLIGVLAGRLNLAEMTAIINRRSGVYQTDEAFLVNRSSLYVTQPRLLDDPAVFQRGLHTEPVRRCLARNSGSMLTDDYRSIPVIATYRWIPERDLCLIVKVDQAEAYAPVSTLAGAVALIEILVLLISAGLAVGLARTFTRPILTLQAGVARFGQGDLDVRLPESTGDELGLLAHEFNRMAEALAREQTHLRRRLERMYTLTVELISTLSFDGYFKDLNPAFEKLLGYSNAELLAVPYIEFVHPDDRSATRATFAALLAGQEAHGFENRYRCKDGSWKWLAWNATADPDVQLVYAVARDISQVKQSEAALQTALGRFQRIVDANIIGVIIARADGSILEANDYYLGMLGYSQEDLKTDKLRWTDITPPEFLYLDEIALRELDQKDTCAPYEKQYFRRDGSRIWVLLVDAILPGPDRDIAGFVLDITAQKSLEYNLSSQRDELRTANARLAQELAERLRVEEEIQRLNEELEERVRIRTAQLEDSNKELEAFSYSVSHDLRSPLRGIDGWSMALLEDYNDRFDAVGRSYLQRVRSETRRMGQLIDDLLQLSRVTRADLKIDLVDLSEIARSVLTRLQAGQPERLAEVKIQPNLTAPGDGALLEIAITNLLENAWKFTGNNQPAVIEFGQVEDEGRRVFCVRDNGVGFDMAYAHKLFGAFQRLHKVSEFPGTGVGLATVQRIIRRHGGQVWAEAQVDRGAAFFFTLGENA